MKSMLFCTSFFRSEDEWQGRYMRWLKHYEGRVDSDVRFFLIDDSSPFTPDPAQIRCVPDTEDLTLVNDHKLIVRFPERLGRASVSIYPGWWRSFLHSVVIARSLGIQKIIHIESDAFVLSSRLMDYINGLNSGWTTLWTQEYRMPETAIQVICEDQFEKMEIFRNRDRREFEGQIAENLLPFTCVNKDFLGDRYGEFRIHLLQRGLLRSRKFRRMKFFQHDFFRARIPAKADFATQVTPDLELPRTLAG